MPTADADSPILLWFRRDLRLADNPALARAVASGRPVLPLFILDDEAAPGAAARWWLHHSLAALAAALGRIGLPLVLRRGRAAEVLDAVIAESGADTVLWNRLYHPAAVARDTAIKQDLRARGLVVESLDGALLFEPWDIRNKAGAPFKVFTPFWRACLAAPEPAAPLAAPHRARAATAPQGDRLADWALTPTRPDWAAGFAALWRPGEAEALARLHDFVDDALRDYARARDRPDLPATSRLSPHLAFGEIGPRQVWHAVHHAIDRDPILANGGQRFLSELGWREFSHHLMFHEGDLATRPLRPEFAAFPWRRDETALRLWQRGLTGYPIVDAGMRELWRTGWMHNRVRMIAASFLVKDLLLPWQDGETWFRDTLVDADPANNAAGWQWVAGCGADAAPFFRIFNPVLQGRKFDPSGAYVRRFVPELAALPAAAIHDPWNHADLTARHGIVLGRDYPRPLVDHDAARRRALAAFEQIKTRDAA